MPGTCRFLALGVSYPYSLGFVYQRHTDKWTQNTQDFIYPYAW